MFGSVGAVWLRYFGMFGHVCRRPYLKAHTLVLEEGDGVLAVEVGVDFNLVNQRLQP